MKQDMRSVAEGIPFPVYGPDGVPFVCGEEFSHLYGIGYIKLVVCQACFQPFLVSRSFEGDPPFHSERFSGDPCVGNTMLHLDASDVGEFFAQVWWDALERLVLKEASCSTNS